MSLLAVPPERLDAETLQALMEEYVTRDGTDYGFEELGLEERVRRLENLLRSGKAIIAFDSDSEDFNIIRDEAWRELQAQSAE